MGIGIPQDRAPLPPGNALFVSVLQIVGADFRAHSHCLDIHPDYQRAALKPSQDGGGAVLSFGHAPR
ncbi:hypothetical protein GCM10010207_78000 [Streptomyces atratus]|nr:hypothetical protein GCM10010207_78000 [Streptomyces atratus]